jgi:hypothetical protein
MGKGASMLSTMTTASSGRDYRRVTKAEAAKFVVANAVKYFAEASFIFSESATNRRVVVFSHGSPTALPMLETLIADKTDFSKLNASFIDLTVLGCGCAGSHSIADLVATRLKATVYAVNLRRRSIPSRRTPISATLRRRSSTPC